MSYLHHTEHSLQVLILKKIDNVVFASPSKSRIRNLQSIGRGLRKADGKDSMRLFDIADDLQCDNFTLQSLERKDKYL